MAFDVATEGARATPTTTAMTVQSILSIDIEPLAPTDTVGRALYRLADLDVAHLPVVGDDGRLLTVIAGDDLLEQLEPDATLDQVAGRGAVCVSAEAHWYEAASLLARNQLSMLPVIDRSGQYIGMVRRSDLFDRFAGSLSTGSPGAIIILEVPPRDFCLSQLVHLIEQSDGKVLSLSTQGQEQAAAYGPLPIHVTLKLSSAETSRIKHVLDHHGYHVVAAFNEVETEEVFNRRLAAFLRYLEV